MSGKKTATNGGFVQVWPDGSAIGLQISFVQWFGQDKQR
jgi:hypothetical protein